MKEQPPEARGSKSSFKAFVAFWVWTSKGAPSRPSLICLSKLPALHVERSPAHLGLMKMRRTFLSSLTLVLASALTSACGGGEDDEKKVEDVTASSDGTVTSEWSEYCTATFTEDYQFVNAFGDDTFVAEEGEEYLVGRLDVGDDTDLLFLTSVGPEDLQVPTGDGSPVEFSCGDMVETYYAVFDDVTVYETQDLITPLCELSKGDVTSTDGGTGYFSVGSGSKGAMIYEVILGGFSEVCGASSGYVSVPRITVWGTVTWLVPFQQLTAPAE